MKQIVNLLFFYKFEKFVIFRSIAEIRSGMNRVINKIGKEEEIDLKGELIEDRFKFCFNQLEGRTYSHYNLIHIEGAMFEYNNEMTYIKFKLKSLKYDYSRLIFLLIIIYIILFKTITLMKIESLILIYFALFIFISILAILPESLLFWYNKWKIRKKFIKLFELKKFENAPLRP